VIPPVLSPWQHVRVTAEAQDEVEARHRALFVRDGFPYEVVAERIGWPGVDGWVE
jgi:hypothetical protein